MKTAVGLSHENKRKLPWLVYWWSDPDYETGKQRKYSESFPYKADAKAFQAKKQAELDAGGQRDKPLVVTLSQLLDEFTAARLASLSYSSQQCYKNTLDQLLEHFGKDRKIRDIGQRRAETFMATRKRRDQRPGELSSWAKSQHLKQCRAVFGAAVAWGYLSRNPFSPPQSVGSSSLRIKPKSRPWHHITPVEFNLFLAEVLTARERSAYWLMYGCGLRPGEVYNLMVEKIDLDSRRVYLENRAATDDNPPFTIKADGMSAEGKERCVPIPAAVIADLTEAMAQAFKSGGFVVLAPERFLVMQRNWRLCRAGKPWGACTKHRPWQNRDMLNNMLRNTKVCMRRADVTLSSPLTLTTFRKSFGQNHADNGTPPRTLAKLLGHSDVQVTMEFYNRVTDANEQAAAATIDRILNSSKGSDHVRNAG